MIDWNRTIQYEIRRHQQQRGRQQRTTNDNGDHSFVQSFTVWLLLWSFEFWVLKHCEKFNISMYCTSQKLFWSKFISTVLHTNNRFSIRIWEMYSVSYCEINNASNSRYLGVLLLLLWSFFCFQVSRCSPDPNSLTHSLTLKSEVWSLKSILFTFSSAHCKVWTFVSL